VQVKGAELYCTITV